MPGLMAANHEHQVIGDFGNFDNLSRARNFIHIWLDRYCGSTGRNCLPCRADYRTVVALVCGIRIEDAAVLADCDYLRAAHIVPPCIGIHAIIMQALVKIYILASKQVHKSLRKRRILRIVNIFGFQGRIAGCRIITICWHIYPLSTPGSALYIFPNLQCSAPWSINRHAGKLGTIPGKKVYMGLVGETAGICWSNRYIFQANGKVEKINARHARYAIGACLAGHNALEVNKDLSVFEVNFRRVPPVRCRRGQAQAP